MSRPEYPNCVMTAGIINHIRQEQEYYDQNPERYERQEQEEMARELRAEMAKEAELNYYRNLEENTSPF